MAQHDDDLGGPKQHNITVRFLVDDAEVQICAGNRRQLCILAEQFLRHMHTQGFQPRVTVECADASDRVSIERYLSDVSRDLDLGLESKN